MTVKLLLISDYDEILTILGKFMIMNIKGPSMVPCGTMQYDIVYSKLSKINMK